MDGTTMVPAEIHDGLIKGILQKFSGIGNYCSAVNRGDEGYDITIYYTHTHTEQSTEFMCLCLPL